ncbi:carboxypeptidase M32 [Alicyclobacillus cycloheptanicus]|uniref:Metal-dependent carboxypeptidase n=1 Tax=Alicyclobacillus cycloheptanicus TaxID=1457 RepID=A0ABT9XIQ6_9BACL|nr:carboxypeptidase M32 [Alicyclobacillus cycloheptanicus]MDQ0190010.1 carboxypeptidase Taq [Alicyclobacillus cycloheptanicus]WDM00085.1 carboxypeptidase M32 [Alicyclobacillus cycloheptanicus]
MSFAAGQTAAQTFEALQAYVKKMLHYQEALELIYWDLRTGAPKKSVELRSETIGTLSDELFRMSTSDQLAEYLEILSDPGVFSTLERKWQRTIEELQRELDRSRKIPPERNKAYVMLTSQAESVWEEARAQSNFEMFRPYLEQIVAMNIEFVEYWGYDENKYDTLLDLYEPGMTVAQVDKIFGGLREETVKLVQAIAHSGRRIDETPFVRRYDVAKQRELGIMLLEAMGYDFNAGRLDETVHPFETAINRFDVRVTTKYLPDDVRSNIFSVIHEGGHALYEQGVSTDLIGTPLCGGASMGIHESQSRFWENMIGRTREFWEFNYGKLLKLFPSQLADVSLEDFYRGVNVVQPSLIRIEADEVTYNLHIMIRYEIEKGLINGQLRVADLPGIWRDKMKEYLGVVPGNDAEGVLQDVHWSGGSFGYFPTYALGNIYAAQFRNALQKAIPDYLEHVRRGNLGVIKQWLNDNIHRHGKMLKPAQIVEQVTGEAIDSKYLVAYLKEKFGQLYGV